MALNWLLITSDKGKEHDTVEYSLSHTEDYKLNILIINLINVLLLQHQLPTLTQICKRQTVKDRVSSVWCWTSGNDGVSVAGVVWLSVIVSGLKLMQGWVTQAPNVNHHCLLVWLSSPRRRHQTIWPRSIAWTCTLNYIPSFDHPDSVASWNSSVNLHTVTTTPNTAKLIGQMTEMSLWVCLI